MTQRKRSRGGSLLAVAGGLFCFAVPLGAQQRISGRVDDPAGRPVANVEVILHRVTPAGGISIDRDTSRMDGRFELRAEAPTDSAAVYFVAARYAGELYVGEMLRPPFPADREYIVQVGVGSVSERLQGIPGATETAETSDNRAAGLVVIVLSALVIGVIVYVALRPRPSERRRLLVDLALLEEAAGKDPARRQRLERRRREIESRLLNGPDQ